MPIEVEEVYSWMAFVLQGKTQSSLWQTASLACSQMENTRYVGWQPRRQDTPLFVVNAQLQVLQTLSKEKDPSQLTSLLPEVLSVLREKTSVLYTTENFR